MGNFNYFYMQSCQPAVKGSIKNVGIGKYCLVCKMLSFLLAVFLVNEIYIFVKKVHFKEHVCAHIIVKNWDEET